MAREEATEAEADRPTRGKVERDTNEAADKANAEHRKMALVVQEKADNLNGLRSWLDMNVVALGNPEHDMNKAIQNGISNISLWKMVDELQS